MWRFNKAERKEIWEEEIQWPIGDIDAAHRIREICRSAADSAEKIGGSADRQDHSTRKYDAERYQCAAHREFVREGERPETGADIVSRGSGSIDPRRFAKRPSGAAAVSCRRNVLYRDSRPQAVCDQAQSLATKTRRAR
jgi:hypothetical protein